MNKIWRAFAVIAVIYALVMGLLSVQYFFDRGDMKKAARVIYRFKPDNDKEASLIQLMAGSWQVNQDDVRCETQVMSRYEGHVFVECGLKTGFEKNSTEKNYHWIVDVVAGRIVAKNDKAKFLMQVESK